MDRRTLLRVLGGATVSIAGLPPQELTALVKATGRRVPQAPFFTDVQREAVRAVADLIIPATDTPGAVEAGVVQYIEMIVAEWMTSEERERFMRGLAHLDEHTQALAAVRFAHAEVSLQVAILEGLEAEGRALGGASTEFPEMYGEEEDAVSMPFFHSIRALVLHGYYTSEIGMKEELLFREIPGRYDGCVDVSEVTRPAPESE